MKKIILGIAVIVLLSSGVAFASEPIYGCTNSKATNYNPLATIDNGTCTFPSNQNPLFVFQPFFGLTGFEIVARGWTLKPGQEDCPSWYPMGCWKKK